MKNAINRAVWLTTLGTASLSLALASASAETLSYDGIDIEPGFIHNQAGATSFGWAGNWSSAHDAAAVYDVSATDLAYSNLETVGGSIEIQLPDTGANFGDAYTLRELEHAYDETSTGTLWFSAVIQANFQGDPADGGFIQAGLSNGSDNSVWVGTGWAGDHWAGGGDHLDPSSAAPTTEPLVNGDTVFMAFEVDFNASHVNFYMNPTPGAESAGTPFATIDIDAEDGIQISHALVWAGNWGVEVEGQGEEDAEGADFIGSLVDEIRVGTTWASVSPADGDPVEPEPTEWAGYPVGDSGWVSTGAGFMGMLYVEHAPWIFSAKLNRYLYIPEAHIAEDGAWGFVPAN